MNQTTIPFVDDEFLDSKPKNESLRKKIQTVEKFSRKLRTRFDELTQTGQTGVVWHGSAHITILTTWSISCRQKPRPFWSSSAMACSGYTAMRTVHSRSRQACRTPLAND